MTILTLAQIDPVTGELPPYLELFNYSPIINGIIVLLSLIALVLFFYFLASINSGSMAPTAFIDDVTKLIVQRQYTEAATLCRSHREVFAASVVLRCVENAGKEHSVIMDMLDSEGKRRADIVWNRISYLADIANVAPMFGLLGTVVGMIKAFFLLPTQAGGVTSDVLARGIGQAMSTTMFGLIVAILALFCHSVVKSRVTRALADVEQVVHSLADHIKRDAHWAKAGGNLVTAELDED